MASDEPSTPPLTGIVLAGGDSTRFANGDKALARLGGQPLIARVVDALIAATDRSPIVTVRNENRRDAYALVLDAARFEYDDSTFDGPLAGVMGAIETADTPWVFVCGADMPLLSAESIRWLATHIEPTRGAIAPRRASGPPEPLHTFYRRDAVMATRDKLTPSTGVRALLSHLDVHTIPVTDAPATIPLRTSLVNVNTRGELDSLRDHDPDM